MTNRAWKGVLLCLFTSLTVFVWSFAERPSWGQAVNPAPAPAPVAIAQIEEMGVIRNPGPNAIVVRDSAPSTIPFYSLGNRLCSIDDDTVFRIKGQQQLFNDEVWYNVELIPDRTVSTTCNFERDGDALSNAWIIGQFANGEAVLNTWQVERPYRSAPSPTPTPEFSPSQTPETYPPTAADDIELSQRAQERQGPGERARIIIEFIKTLVRYPFILLGTCIGLIVIIIEREDSKPNFSFSRIRKHHIKTWLFLYRLILLFVVNSFAINFVAAPAEVLASDDLLIQSIERLSGSNIGVFSLGFILTVIFLKFISFVDEGSG